MWGDGHLPPTAEEANGPLDVTAILEKDGEDLPSRAEYEARVAQGDGPATGKPKPGALTIPTVGIKRTGLQSNPSAHYLGTDGWLAGA